MTELNPEQLSKVEVQVARFVAEYERDARNHFAAFMPGIVPAEITADKSPDRNAFAAVHSMMSEAGPLASASGVYAFGKSGTGKSCAAAAWFWHLVSPPDICVRRLASGCEEMILHVPKAADSERSRCRESIKRFRFNPELFQLWSGSELKDAFNEVCRDREAKSDLLFTLTRADVLLIDDLGHTMSPPFAENLRLVLDRWQGDWLLITSQYSPPQLVQRWGRNDAGKSDMREQAEALVRRIQKHCAGVHFVRGAS